MTTLQTDRKNILILAFTLCVMLLGYGLVMPILPFYIEHLGAGGELGLLIASYAIMRLIFGPVWGSLSDRIGRKPVLMIGVLGYGLTMVLFGFANQFWMLLVIRSLSGILSSATSPTTMAYVSDSTSEKDRGGGMGLLGAAVGVGTIIGPGLGGLLARQSLQLPFFVAGALSFLSLALIAAFLPESHPSALRQPVAGSRPARLGGRLLWQAWRSSIGSLLAVTFLASFALTAFSGVFGLFAARQYGYTPEQVGGLYVVMGVVLAVGQGLLTGPLTRRWGEAAVIKISLLATALGFGLLAWASSGLAASAALAFFTLAVVLLGPAVTALLSKWSRLEAGMTMGLNSSFESLGRIFGPLAAGLLFDWNPLLPFLTGAAVMLTGFVWALARLPDQAPVEQPA